MKAKHEKNHKSFDEKLSDEIDKEVEEVKREWRHFIKFKDENYLLFTAFVIVISAILIVNTVYVLNHNSTFKRITSSRTVVLPDSSKVLTSQQTGSNSAEIVTVSSVTENSQTDHAFAMAPNDTMLIMNISIKNNSSETKQLIPVNQMFVRSREGDYSPLHASMYVTTPLAATDLAPGQSATGQLSFSVPKHIAHPLLYVDTGWDKTVPLVFDVLH